MNNELCQDFVDWNFVPRGYLDYLCRSAASKSWRFVVLFCQIWPVYKERYLRLSDESRLFNSETRLMSTSFWFDSLQRAGLDLNLLTSCLISL